MKRSKEIERRLDALNDIYRRNSRLSMFSYMKIRDAIERGELAGRGKHLIYKIALMHAEIMGWTFEVYNRGYGDTLYIYDKTVPMLAFHFSGSLSAVRNWNSKKTQTMMYEAKGHLALEAMLTAP